MQSTYTKDVNYMSWTYRPSILTRITASLVVVLTWMSVGLCFFGVLLFEPFGDVVGALILGSAVAMGLYISGVMLIRSQARAGVIDKGNGTCTIAFGRLYTITFSFREVAALWLWHHPGIWGIEWLLFVKLRNRYNAVLLMGFRSKGFLMGNLPPEGVEFVDQLSAITGCACHPYKGSL